MSRNRYGKKLEYGGTTFRSKFEVTIAKWLMEHKIKYKYESVSYPFVQPKLHHVCSDCGSNAVGHERSYTPDFYLPEYDITLEVKGLFTTDNRKVIKAVRNDHPDLDLRMVFLSDNFVYRGAKMRYSGWCEQQEMLWSVGAPKVEWFK